MVHEIRWHATLEAIIGFRRTLKQTYGLKLRDEVHAAHFVQRPGELARIEKYRRMHLLRDVLDFEASLPDVSVINVVVEKTGKSPTYDVFESAWTALVQRFHNTISYRNFPGPQNAQDFGLLVTDRTDEKRLQAVVRRMRRYNMVPSQIGLGSHTLVEDPVHRDSAHSYFIQLSDVNAYFLAQKLHPCRYVREKGGRNYFDRIDRILCKKASAKDPQGVVRL